MAEPNLRHIEAARRIVGKAAGRMRGTGGSKSDVAIGVAIAALELMRDDIGPPATIEWLRSTADLQEAELLKGRAGRESEH